VTLALPLSAPVPAPEITPRAATDIVWLEHALGRRYFGWQEEEDTRFGRFCVTLRRADGRFKFVFGNTVEEAVGKARAHVKAASEAATPRRRWR
jgi:hypothetical protein